MVRIRCTLGILGLQVVVTGCGGATPVVPSIQGEASIEASIDASSGGGMGRAAPLRRGPRARVLTGPMMSVPASDPTVSVPSIPHGMGTLDPTPILTVPAQTGLRPPVTHPRMARSTPEFCRMMFEACRSGAVGGDISHCWDRYGPCLTANRPAPHQQALADAYKDLRGWRQEAHKIRYSYPFGPVLRAWDWMQGGSPIDQPPEGH